MGLSFDLDNTAAYIPAPRRPTPRGLVHEMIRKATADMPIPSPDTVPTPTREEKCTTQPFDGTDALPRRGYASSSSEGGLRLFVEPQEVPVDAPHTLDIVEPPEISPQGRPTSQSPFETWTESTGDWTFEHLIAWGMAIRQGDSEAVNHREATSPISQAAGLDAVRLVDMEAPHLGRSPRQQLATNILRRAAMGPMRDSLTGLIRVNETHAKSIIRMLHAAFLWALPAQQWPSIRGASATEDRQEMETDGAADGDFQSNADTTELPPMMANLQLTPGTRRRAARSAPYDLSPTSRRGTRPIRQSRRRLNRQTEY